MEYGLSRYYGTVSTQESVNCNVLLIGKSGAGKSTFCNYLFGTMIFQEGVGRPVTPNFQHYYLRHGDIRINVYDSKGLEPGNIGEWFEGVDEFLDERQNMDSVNEIIHTLYYVINGSLGSVEEAEMEALQRIKERFDLSATVILTHCDKMNRSEQQEELEKVEHVIRSKYGFTSLRVSSRAVKTRGGEATEPFGREAAIRRLLSDSYEKVGRELTIAVIDEVIDLLRDVRDKAKDKVDATKISIFNLDDADLDGLLEDVLPDNFELEDLIPPAFQSYQNFLEGFDVEYQGRDISDEVWDTLAEIDDIFSEDNISILRKMNNITRDIESGNFWKFLRGAFGVADFAINLKKKIKEMLDEAFALLIRELYDKRWLVEEGLPVNKEEDNDIADARENLRKAVEGLKESTDEIVDLVSGVSEDSFVSPNDILHEMFEDELHELESTDGDPERIAKLREILSCE
jgi:GTP-binding protein EngB required for normal cell division